MYAYNVNEQTLQDLAHYLGFQINTEDQGTRIKFTLRMKPGWVEYRKINPRTERKSSSVCFHGHYMFMDAVFRRCPGAKIESSWYGKITYERHTFKNLANEFGNRRLGTPENVYHEYRIRDQCYCERDT